MSDVIRYVNVGPVVTRKVVTGSSITVNQGSGGEASGIAVNPKIPGLNATNVQEAIVELQNGTDFQFSFSYGDATPATILIANATKLVRTVTITILVPLNGINPRISVGDAGNVERLFPASAIDPLDAATEWEYNPNYRYSASTPILLSIVPDGSTQGSGLIYIQRGK
jgi:hypothetical protein